MGVDIKGRRPKSKEGKYFGVTWYGWRPVARLISEKAPDLYGRARYWLSNDGDGLNSREAAELGRRLLALPIDEIATAWNAKLAAIPDERCKYCDGSGKRADGVGRANGFHVLKIVRVGHPRLGQVGWCNACDGTGSHRPSEAAYELDADTVRQFANFCAASGGFEIW